MRVNVAAAAGAALGTLLAAAGDATHPAQIVVMIAAGCAFLAVLSRGRQAAPSDWFTVQVLLAGNLVVFGISNADRLGMALAVSVVLVGVVLLVAAAWMRVRGAGRGGRDR
jgi:ABC-type spermidine/putrescine transport system permease subunit I